MSDITLQRNVGSLVTVRRGTAAAAAIAGSTGDATTSTGDSVDRAAIGMPLSAVFATCYEATLASGESLSIATTVQHATDNSSFTDYATEASTVVASAPGGAAVKKGTHSFSVNFSSAYRYVKVNSAPDLSASGTDTAVCRTVAVFGGVSPLPASA